MKKVTSFLLAVILMFTMFSITAFAEELPQMQVEVKAKSAILMDAGTGTVLMEKNAHDKLFPASVTKIMSLLLITEAIDQGKIALTDTVTASTAASKMGGSEIWLKEGETMSVDELLKATVVASANDACYALSEVVSGSNEAFVKRMNERAKELGMNDTNFENCTGLDDTATNHLTSAYDIAIMSMELLKHQRIMNYSTIWMDSLRNGATELVNTNKLVRFYEGTTGLKTGTTGKAGCCVSATAKRDDLHLIAVVMGSDNSNDRFDGAKAMLNWGFSNYSAYQLMIEKEQIPAVNVLHGAETTLVPYIPDAITTIIEKGREKEITQVVDLVVDVEAPVEKGQVLGSVIFKLDDKEIYKYNLVSEKAILKLTFFESFKRIILSLCK
ncbi:MAG: D-alanyl-D-alanine carboxypeptidase family protein [Oscillospiraceae bacterium]